MVIDPDGAPDTPEYESADDERAVIVFTSGEWATCERATQTVVFHLTHALSDAVLAHPYFSSTGTIAAHWSGMTPLHAGSVLLDGVAWAVMGDRERGKSTTMAELHSRGVTIFADDLVVVDENLTTFAGPRTLDLREDGAARFPEAVYLDGIRSRERFRIDLADCQPTAPLGGLLALEWGDEFSVAPMPVPQRIATLVEHYSVMLPASSPRALLQLAQLPFYVVTRPKNLSTLPATVDAILGLGS